MITAFQPNAFQNNAFQIGVTPPLPPPALQLGGAGAISGQGIFRPQKYFRAFHYFLGLARRKKRKQEAKELRKLIRLTAKLDRGELRPSEIGGAEAARGLLILQTLDEALDRYVERAAIEDDDEEEAVIMLFMN